MRWAAATPILLLAGVSGCRQAPSPANGPIGSVAEIRSLTEPRLRSGLPVRFTGSVIYWEPRTRLLIVSDESGGILVDRLDPRLEVRDGTKVSVQGYTGYDSFTPMVVKASVAVEKGAVPVPAKSITPRDFLAGRYEHQLIQVPARLESLSTLVADESRSIFNIDGVRVNGVV